MKVIRFDVNSVPTFEKPICLCLGYFDGVHLGHQRLINQAKVFSDLEIGVLTFSNPISKFIKNNKSNKILTSLDDRFQILSKFSLDYFLIVEINEDFLNLSKESFIDLLKKMNVHEIVVGNDYTFGVNAIGKIEDLQSNFKTCVIDLIKEMGEKISTQNIIKKIELGLITDSTKLLGRNYQIKGIVKKGFGQGKTLGFPTANLQILNDYVLPKNGVYKVVAYIDGIPHFALANVGIHPTINKLQEPIIEVHIPNFNDCLYDKSMYVEFLDFLRDEMTFDSLGKLKRQITKDLEAINIILN